MNVKDKEISLSTVFDTKISNFVILALTCFAYFLCVKFGELGMYLSVLLGIFSLIYALYVKNYKVGVPLAIVQIFMFFFAYIIGMTVATMLFNMGITSSL